MSYWEITVLAAAKLGCNCNYDQRSDLAQNRRALRQIMGIGDWDDERDGKKFDFRRIEHNLDLLSPETIAEINAAIVTEGHRLEPEPAETVRADSFVDEPCLPMPGAEQAAEQNRAASVQFRQARQSHPGVESAIHTLQSGNGLKRCRDRSERGFERYIGLGMLGRSLHVLGKLLLACESPDSAARSSRRKSAA